MEVKVIGQMDNTIDHTFESANRVYDKNGLSPTINCCGGGGLQPKIIDEYGSLYGQHSRWGVFNKDGISPTLVSAMGEGGGYTPMTLEQMCISTKGKENEVASTILAGYERTNMTGFNADNGVLKVEKIDVDGCYLFQSEMFGGLNIQPDKVSTTIKASKVDCGCIEKYTTKYRIRKLTPKECWRLMDFTDEDFEKAAQVNSNTQLYKQVGNSIVKNVLVAIFGQMISGKEEIYKNI